MLVEQAAGLMQPSAAAAAETGNADAAESPANTSRPAAAAETDDAAAMDLTCGGSTVAVDAAPAEAPKKAGKDKQKGARLAQDVHEDTVKGSRSVLAEVTDTLLNALPPASGDNLASPWLFCCALYLLPCAYAGGQHDIRICQCTFWSVNSVFAVRTRFASLNFCRRVCTRLSLTGSYPKCWHASLQPSSVGKNASSHVSIAKERLAMGAYKHWMVGCHSCTTRRPCNDNKVNRLV